TDALVRTVSRHRRFAKGQAAGLGAVFVAKEHKGRPMTPITFVAVTSCLNAESTVWGDALEELARVKPLARGGHEEFRGDLGPMYFPTLEPETGRLLRLEMVPTQMKRLRAQRASPADARRLRTLLDREGGRFGTSTTPGASQGIELKWKKLSDSRVPSP
ncbi:MAG: hypothetical protein ABI728_05480, partial [Betaproteobacteria bacterium]